MAPCKSFTEKKLAYEVFLTVHLSLDSGYDGTCSNSHSPAPFESVCFQFCVQKFSLLFVSKNTMTSFKNLSLAFSSTDKMGSQFLERWCAPAVYSLLNPPSVTSVISMQLTETFQAQDYQWYGLQWGMHSRSRCTVDAEKEKPVIMQTRTHNEVVLWKRKSGSSKYAKYRKCTWYPEKRNCQGSWQLQFH